MANYSVIGSDLKEYGPVSSEELRKWIAEGRIAADSKVRPEGGTEWLPVSQVPELAGALKKSSPPPIPASAFSPPNKAKTSGLAVTSLVLGILGFFSCGVTALVGLIFGIIALVKVSNSKGALRGKSIALAGTIISAVFLVMIPFFAALLLPALAAAKAKAQEINCINNEKQLALAVRIYSSSNTNHFPPAATWCDAIKPSVGSDRVFKCPAANPNSRCDYAYNAKLDGADANSVNPQTVMIFESDAGWNAHGGPELEVLPRHRQHIVIVAFADGSVQRLQTSSLGSLRWNP